MRSCAFEKAWASWVGSDGDGPRMDPGTARHFWNAAVEEAAVIASRMTPGPIHPDIPWERMNDSAQTAAHTTAQQIAMKIGDLRDDPRGRASNVARQEEKP